MVLAAHDMGHSHVDIVDDAGQHVEPASVLAPHHGVREQGGIEMLMAADQVVPLDRRLMLELEPPVRPPSLGLEPRPVRLAQRERGAVVDRRQASPELDLAPELELLRRLVGRIDPPRRVQSLQRGLVAAEPVRLAVLFVGIEPEPGKILADRRHERLFAPCLIGIVEPKDELAPRLSRPQPVVKRGADVADVEPAGRRGGEAGDDAHKGSMPSPLILRSR